VSSVFTEVESVLKAESTYFLDIVSDSLLDLAKSLVINLASVESEFLKKFHLINFELQNVGSFISYVSRHPKLLGDLLIRTIGPLHEQLTVIAKSSEKDVPSTDVDCLSTVRTIDRDSLNEELENLLYAYTERSTVDNWFDVLCDIEKKLLGMDDQVTGFSIDGQVLTFLDHISSISTENSELSDKLFALLPVKVVSQGNGEVAIKENIKEIDSPFAVDLFHRTIASMSTIDSTFEDRVLLAMQLLARKTDLSQAKFPESVLLSTVTTKATYEESSLLFAKDHWFVSCSAPNSNDLKLTSMAKTDLVSAFSSLPIGRLCSRSLNWIWLQKKCGLSKGNEDACIPILLEEIHAELKQLCPTKLFMIISADDALTLPAKLPVQKEIGTVLQNSDAKTMMAWILRAMTLPASSQETFFINVVSACELVSNNMNDNVNQFVARWCLFLIKASVDMMMQVYILQLWISNVMAVTLGRVSEGHCEKFLIQHLQSIDQEFDWNEAVENLLLIAEACKDNNNKFPNLQEWAGSTLKPFHRLPSTTTNQSSEKIQNKPLDASSSNVAIHTDELTTISLEAFASNTQGSPDGQDPNTCQSKIKEIFSSDDIQASFKGSFNNALKLLSKINSRDVHFVLEVIQNAADNSYPGGTKPTLMIQLNQQQIIVKSNENGFNNDNVLAICSVGKSHKKNTVGFIGHKGIG
jgi:hypothetical protein